MRSSPAPSGSRAAAPLSVPERASQAELLTQRGQILGRISDYERAETIAEALVRDAPTTGAPGSRGRARRATFHRFADALADVAEAERRGVDAAALDGVRVGILQATGHERGGARDPPAPGGGAPGHPRRSAARRPLHAARGKLDEAERLFAAAVASYRDVSPFPVAWIEFQRGLMWMREDQLERARAWLAAAHARLPQYAQARGHLAEVEAALGNVDRAVALLEPLAATRRGSRLCGAARAHPRRGRPRRRRRGRGASARPRATTS